MLQGWEHNTPAKSSPSWGELLSAVTGTFVVRDLPFACLSSSVCLVWPVQCGDLQCMTAVLNHSGSQIRSLCLVFFQPTYQCSVSIH